MDEKKDPRFTEITGHIDMMLDGDLKVAAALLDEDLIAFLQEYIYFKNDIVRRMSMIASGDWAEEHHYQERYFIVLDAVRLRFGLNEKQMRIVMETATQQARA